MAKTYAKADEVVSMKCKICGREVEPKETKYTVKVTKMMTANIKTYAAFDCPKCGCQQFASLRHLEEENNEQKTKTCTAKAKQKEKESRKKR